MPDITDVRPILTAPDGINLVVVRVDTSEPGLYGLGCATFTQRCTAVCTVVSDYLRPLLVGRDARRIEELFQLMMVHAYWRNGPVLNNAIAGVDTALWDIKGKSAGLPVYELLGGKCREAAAVYRHADGAEPAEVLANARRFMEAGVRHVRIQCGGYGGPADDGRRPEGALAGAYYDPCRYTRLALAAIERVRGELGDDVELLHDVHERLRPAEAVAFAAELQRFRLFFLEDPLAPEDLDWLGGIRRACTTPIAIGELFCHPREWTPLITSRHIDFMRMHVSQMGGLTPARKVAALGELHGVRTAWHGPGDVSPIGHAVNLHLDLACWNFGIQEFAGFGDNLRAVFPGSPELRGGYLYANDRPGWGVDLDEAAAARFPPRKGIDRWTQARLPDGTITRP